MKNIWKVASLVLGVILVFFVIFRTVSKAGEGTNISKSRILEHLLGINPMYNEFNADYNDDRVITLEDAFIAERIEAYGESYQDVINPESVDDTKEDNVDESSEETEETTDTNIENDETASEENSEDVTTDGESKSEEADSEESSEDDDSVVSDIEGSNWIYVDASLAEWSECYIYSWETGEMFTKMTEVEGSEGVYKASLPEGVINFLFINNDDSSWDNKNQTIDVSLQDYNMIYTLEKESAGKYSGSWSEYQ